MSGLLQVFSLLLPCLANANIILHSEKEKAVKKNDLMIGLVSSNLNRNGWSNILCIGEFPSAFYTAVINLNFTLTILDPSSNTKDVEEVVAYHSHTVIMHCTDLNDFEQTLLKTMASPYWHPLAHHILYYDAKDKEDYPKIFIIFWFYKAFYAIIIQYNDVKEIMSISHYNPYISENFRLTQEFGCWKATKLGWPIQKFRDSFVCVEGCQNVTLHSKLRSQHLGTCIGFETGKIPYADKDIWKVFNPFQDKTKDLHGFVMRGCAGQLLPFLAFTNNSDGTVTSTSRDGMIWNVASKAMNFKIHLSGCKTIIKNPFNYQNSIHQIYTFARREADVILYPIYQYDIILVEIDMSIPYKDSGVCVLAHRADFETVLFDAKLLNENYELIVRFLLCFTFIWLLLFASNATEKEIWSFDQAGKDFTNAIRSVLSISLYKPPRWRSFRIYLFVSIWAFFIINFSMQAAIISFFSAYKRGKEVDTFEDMIEKGYNFEGIASPDMVLPDTEERFLKINSKLVPVKDYNDCVDRLLNDSRRFCLLDCSVGRYLARNLLNTKGEQYLHIAKDRIHGYYLNMIFHKHSPLTENFNKYLRMFFESGLVMKWEQYRFNDVRPEVPVKALNLDDLIGIFKCYGLLLAICSAVFVVEIFLGLFTFMNRYITQKFVKWKTARVDKNNLRKPTNRKQIMVSTFTQTETNTETPLLY